MGTQGSVPQCGTRDCCRADVNSEHWGYQPNKPIVQNDLAVSKATSLTRSEAQDIPWTKPEARPHAQRPEPPPDVEPEAYKPAQEAAPEAPVFEEQNPVVRQEGPIPGMYEIILMRSLGEKWGMDIDYGQGPSLKVGAVHDSGPVADYNDKNPKRPLEANDRIVEIDGEEKTARQMAMHLAQADLVSLSLIIRKHFTMDENGKNHAD